MVETPNHFPISNLPSPILSEHVSSRIMTIFPDSLAAKCSHVTKLWPMEYQQMCYMAT